MLAYFEGCYCRLRPGLSESRIGAGRSAIGQLSRWLGRPAVLTDLTTETVGNFLRWYAVVHSPASTNTRRGQFLALWRAAHRAGLVRSLPGEIPRWREPQRVPQAWTVAEVARLVGYCRALPGEICGLPARWWWSSLILAGYWTGARASAIRSARTDDLTPEGWLLLRAESQKARADQWFRLPAQATDEIARLWPCGRELIWPWPYHPRVWWTHLRRIVEGAGLPCPRRGKHLFQRLRRTSVSYAAAVDLEIARQLAGHSNSGLTRKHYIDPRIASTWTIANVLPTLDLS